MENTLVIGLGFPIEFQRGESTARQSRLEIAGRSTEHYWYF